MNAILFRIGIGGLALAMTLGYAGNVRAETLTYKVALKSASEVPPNAGIGSGTADVTYDTQSKKLSWKVSYSGLTGPATAAHFHGPAEPGKNAGVMIPIQNIATSPAEGSATLTDAQAADLMAGRLYVNVHTAANPGGEIRGQVTK
jgi:CHRD domain